MKGKSQKPDEIYEIIEKMMPGAKKIELFARNNNLREGWLSLGNQLGENFQSWKNIVVCDICKKNIHIGIKRFKSKKIANYDICHYCFENFENLKNGSNSSSNQSSTNKIILNMQNDLSNNFQVENHSVNEFFELKNNIDEDILHYYYSCDRCKCEPIWGNRFMCLECDNYDLCESCFDKELEISNARKIQHQQSQDIENSNLIHVLNHSFKCFEVIKKYFNLRK